MQARLLDSLLAGIKNLFLLSAMVGYGKMTSSDVLRQFSDALALAEPLRKYKLSVNSGGMDSLQDWHRSL